MNLLYITKTSLVGEGGGGEERAREVVDGLSDRGHDVTAICGCPPALSTTSSATRKNA